MRGSVPELILASGSPRRADLLRRMGFTFRIIPSRVPEDFPAGDPASGVMVLSEAKARAVMDKVPGGIIIGADTVVVLRGEILGKPGDNAEAVAMLRRLSGETHMVYTGFALLRAGGPAYRDVEKTEVTFRRLEAWEIQDYVNTGGPLDKAGGYGIQDRSGLFVDSISGCFYNVVGFPLTKFFQGLYTLVGEETLRNMLNKDQTG